MYEVKQQFSQLKNKKDITVLGIESSCDETACAIVRNGREVLSSVISSQIPLHRRFGGVVPEVASRNHTLAITSVLDETLKNANLTFSDIDAIAVTYGAGLVGALLVGVTTAKALAYSLQKPLIKVNHIEAHIASNFVEYKTLTPPFTAVVASGGHTLIVDVEDYNTYKVISSTRDDAIGEAFDKTARLLGLPYPGGPEIDRLAKLGKNNIEFMRHNRNQTDDLALSYSGLKTAVVNFVHNLKQKGEPLPIEDICCSLTHTAVDMLVNIAIKVVKERKRNKIVLAGGVASNSYLRSSLQERAKVENIEMLVPPPVLCTDNAVMVASRAYFSICDGKGLAGLNLNAQPSLRVGEEDV